MNGVGVHLHGPARGIERLLEDPGMRARMGARGRELFLTTYNWNVERERLLSLYRDWDMEPEGTT